MAPYMGSPASSSTSITKINRTKVKTSEWLEIANVPSESWRSSPEYDSKPGPEHRRDDICNSSWVWKPPRCVNSTNPDTSDSKSKHPRDLSQPSVKLNQDAAYIIAPFESTQDIPKLAWSYWGWTFQEKALIFCGKEVTWHCREMICREDMVNDDAENRSKPLGWLRLSPQHFQLFQWPDLF
ncbi:unnamed protein product [Clonostachys byssicola]|uniref:Uncharacterized protein n=1 Tax=Clonostachys byssicola TaxID=160290 RepID=A0A9N9Y600_9HYPO|nr:unnamed protein product [Clonostachys byssicola]